MMLVSAVVVSSEIVAGMEDVLLLNILTDFQNPFESVESRLSKNFCLLSRSNDKTQFL